LGISVGLGLLQINVLAEEPEGVIPQVVNGLGGINYADATDEDGFEFATGAHGNDFASNRTDIIDLIMDRTDYRDFNGLRFSFKFA